MPEGEEAPEAPPRLRPRPEAGRRRRAGHDRRLRGRAAVPSGRLGLDARPARRRAGNPGASTSATATTSVGWWLTSSRAARTAAGGPKFSGQLAEVRLDALRLALLKPETFMNDSGRSVAAATRFFKVEPGVAAGCPRRCRSRAGAPAGSRGRRPRRSQRFAFARADARDAGVPAAEDRRRPARPRRSAIGRRLRALAIRARRGRRGARFPSRRRGRDGRARGRRGGPAALQLGGLTRLRFERGTAGSVFRDGPNLSCTHSSTSSLEDRAARSLRRGAADALLASPSRRCRCCSRRCTSASVAVSFALLPEDADARDAAEAAAWFLGEERVALLPSRGSSLGIGPRAAAAPRR